jgi:hypothetical protein
MFRHNLTRKHELKILLSLSFHYFIDSSVSLAKSHVMEAMKRHKEQVDIGNQ